MSTSANVSLHFFAADEGEKGIVGEPLKKNQRNIEKSLADFRGPAVPYAT